ncbi:MAG: hypothetical protein ACLFUP_06140 [Desulfobacteraceae bacterium]
MPLGFKTINKGEIAFGFFNIETDLLLLDRFFLFAPEFCGYIGELADHQGSWPVDRHWDTDFIQDPMEVGDLMGAIHGIRYIGFIGEVYRRYPFPRDPEDFRQNPEGWRTREEIESILQSYAQKTLLPVHANPAAGRVQIGGFDLDLEVFQELVRYVWLGGYPRWRGMVRPPYVMEMKQRIEAGSNLLFRGLRLS